MNQPVLVWLVLSLIWGSTWLFIKIGLATLPPFTFAGLRFLIAAPLLWSLAWWRGSALPRRSDVPLLLLAGFFGFAINYGLIFWGEQRISSGLAAVLQAMIPAFAMFFAHYLLPGEPVSARKLAGVALGWLGTGVIFYHQLSIAGGSALAGSAAILLSSATAAFPGVLSKKSFQHIAPEVLAASQMSCAIVPLLGMGWWLEGNPFALRWTFAALGSLLYLALVGSALAFLLFYWLVKRMEVTKVMLISLVTPVLALLLGKLTLDEPLTWRLAAGSAAILSGIGLIVVQRARVAAPNSLQANHADH